MPVKSSPEVFNSRGKVTTTRSLPTLVNSRGSTSTNRLNIRSIVASLMQDVKTGASVELVVSISPGSIFKVLFFLSKGVPVGLAVSTKLRQFTLSDSSQLTLLLSEILNYALQTTSIEVGVSVVVHFNPRKQFSLSLLDALTTLLTQCPDHPQLPALLASLCHNSHLAPQAPALSLLVLEKLLCWVTATLNVPEDLERIDMAQRLLADTAGFLTQYAPSGLCLFSRQVWVSKKSKFLSYHTQVRATLLGSQAGRTFCCDRLLDLFVALNRLRTPDGNGYIVDSVDDCNSNVGSSLNVKLLKPMDFKPKLEEENKLESEVVVEEENNIAIGGNTADAQEEFLTRNETSLPISGQ